MAGRADPFGEALDLTGSKPKKLASVADGAAFPRREAVPVIEPAPALPAPEKAMRRMYGTGRNAQSPARRNLTSSTGSTAAATARTG